MLKEIARLSIKVFLITPLLAYGLNGPPAKGGGAAFAEESSVYYSLGTFYGMGNIANHSGSIASRSMSSVGAFFQVGYNSGFLTPILTADYHTLNQLTSTTSVSNTNMEGSGYLIGAGLHTQIMKAKLSFQYLRLGNFTLAQKTTLSETIVYKNPKGYLLSLGYEVFSNVEIAFFNKFMEYSQRTTDANLTDIATDKLVYSIYGLNLEWRF